MTAAPVDLVAGVPTLVLEGGTVLTQSMAILEWLDAKHPEPALLPADPVAAAHVRAAVMVIACDVHPVNNLKTGGKLKSMDHTQPGRGCHLDERLDDARV